STAVPQALGDEVTLVAAALNAARRPIIVAGEMRQGRGLAPLHDRVAAATGAAVLAEPTSQLRTAGIGGQGDAYDAILRDPAARGLEPPDLVLRIGGPPTSKALNQFLSRAAARTMVAAPGGAGADPDGNAHAILRSDPGALLAELPGSLSGGADPGWRRGWSAATASARDAISQVLRAVPLFEGHVITALADLLGAGTLWVGSSMPIRDVDSFWPGMAQGPRFLANRGASGIDGFVSTILGSSAAGDAVVGVLGDLTMFHDLNGLWAARRHDLAPKLVLLDNNGGGIFSFLPQAEHDDVFEEVFGTPLDFDLAAAAQLHGFATLEAGARDEVVPALGELLATPGPALLRVRFTRPQSVAGHRACWLAVQD
ncbi:MAG: thiamine pyrophosphate-dependent enzyme, partial [Candidatus Dormibacteria bacterium]